MSNIDINIEPNDIDSDERNDSISSANSDYLVPVLNIKSLNIVDTTNRYFNLNKYRVCRIVIEI